MTTATHSAPVVPSLGPAPFRFSVADYERMIELGLFVGKPRVELREGRVVQYMSQNPPHANASDVLEELLRALTPAGWRVRAQKPVTLSGSVPEPDVCLARGERDTYTERHPRPREIALVAEVADATLLGDRRDKGALYAGENIAVYWIVNLVERRIEVHTRPTGPGAEPIYAHVDIFTAGMSVPLVLDGVEVGTVAVDDIVA